MTLFSKDLSRRSLGKSALAFMLLASGVSLAQAQDKIPVRFGILAPSSSNIYFFLGVEKGIYEAHGLDVQPTTFLRGGPEVIAAAASGQVDIGTLGTPIIIGISRQVPIKVVGSPALKGQEFLLVGTNDTEKVEDLAGATVAVASVGGGQSQALRYILAAHNVDAQSVNEIAYGGGGNGYAAFASGQIKAAIFSEPYATRLIQEGNGKLLAEAKDYYGRYQHSYIFASDAFIASNPEAIRKFFEASAEAIRYARDNREELLDFSEKTLNLDRDLLNTIYDKYLPEWDDTQVVDEEGLVNAVRILKEVGDIDQSFEPELSTIVNTSFVGAGS
ncbi:ABC transporter substrate-binding protein [Aureimonas fodinaquatilis]|uniref:ABC transporter substrate-binding protein n=1 Tax=Aureimonas fodinaquatilis TaxID=2565783 RepID=A0A5B0DVN7_9HYPH|nr:ABC transporter substrate-binding protein [Aureimonas fodinaquatilis]KAA0970897.1 ABC transporter substrate-binding protein [Aureimonas fodinaquatilis]